MPELAIAHFDMDAFYVSVELLTRPELLGKPVVVAGTGPRAVVTTASYAARRFGIESATPAARARRLCPEAFFISPDFTRYRAATSGVMACLRDHFERVDVVGLDEAYVDVSEIDRPRAAVTRARSAILERTGLNCSIGVGPNKLVAKVASDAEKPAGLVVLTRTEAARRFAAAPPRLLPGIGPRTAERLAELGITTIAALAAAQEARLRLTFGARHGAGLARLARFEDDRRLEVGRVRKSESRETTFDTDIHDRERLRLELAGLTTRLCDGLREHGARGRTIGIKIRSDDFKTHTRARSLPAPTSDPSVVEAIAVELLADFDPQRPVRLLGVSVGGLDELAETESRATEVDVADQMALEL